MTMSEKDKNTIIIAAIALLIFGIAFLGIKPAFTSIQETKATNAELSAQKETMEAEINALPTYKTDLETAKSNYKATSDRVYGDLTNDLIHDQVVALVNKAGLTITSLAITDPAAETVSAYAIVDGQGTGGVTEGSAKMAVISVGVAGTSANIIALVEELNTTEGTYLQTASISTTAEEGGSATTISFAMLLSESFE